MRNVHMLIASREGDFWVQNEAGKAKGSFNEQSGLPRGVNSSAVAEFVSRKVFGMVEAWYPAGVDWVECLFVAKPKQSVNGVIERTSYVARQHRPWAFQACYKDFLLIVDQLVDGIWTAWQMLW